MYLLVEMEKNHQWQDAFERGFCFIKFNIVDEGWDQPSMEEVKVVL